MKRLCCLLCQAASVPIPDEVGRVTLEVNLEGSLKSFESGQMEPQDLFRVCSDLVGNDRTLVELCVEMLNAHSGSEVASFVAARLGVDALAPPHSGWLDDLSPECARPFNPRLHAFADRDGIVLSSDDILEDFRRQFRDSSSHVIDFHGTPCTVKNGGKNQIGFVTIYFGWRAYFVMPRLFPSFSREVGRILAMKKSTMIVHRWDRMKKHFRSIFGFDPDCVVDSEVVAEENGRDATLDGISRDVTGGDFCRRASSFVDTAVPSIEARKHRVMRASLIYRFVEKNAALAGYGRRARGRERVEDLRSSGAAASRSRSRVTKIPD